MPVFVGGTYYAYLGIIVFIYGIVAIGLNILSGYAGQFSLGHAAFMAMGAYTTALLTKALAGIPFFAQSGLHIWFGIVCGTILAAISGIVLAVPALRVRGPYLAMVTIAFGWVIWKILQEWVSVTGGDLGISSVPITTPASRAHAHVSTCRRIPSFSLATAADESVSVTVTRSNEHGAALGRSGPSGMRPANCLLQSTGGSPKASTRSI